MASIDRTAYPRFKRVISARELAESFTPTVEEIAWARGRAQTEGHLLSLVVLLKCYQRLGYFPKLPDVPAPVVDHVRVALGVAAGIVAGQESERTLWRHRDFVRTRVGTRYQPREARQIAETAIRAAVEAKDDPADLINVALDEVVRAGLELPGFSTFDKIATTVRTEFNTAVFVRVAARIWADPGGRARLAGLLVTDPVSGRSGVDRLKAPAKAATLSRFKARLAYLAWLDGLGPTGQWLAGVSAQKIAHFAGQARTTDVGDLRDVGEDKRWTLIASLVHECRTAARDEVATMFCKRMAAIHKKGRERLEELREAHRAESERLLGVFGDVLSVVRDATTPPEADTRTDTDIDSPQAGAAGGPAAIDSEPMTVVAERAGQMVLKTLADAGGVAALSAAHEQVAAHHGNNYLPLLEPFYRSHRAALLTLVDTLTLEAATADHAVLDAVAFIRAIRHRRSEWIPEQATVTDIDGQQVTVSVEVDAFAGDLWRTVLRDRKHPGMLSRRHLEVCVFSQLAAELRCGDIAVAGADSFANFHAQLMTWQQCAPLVSEFCAQAGIPADAAELTAFYRAKLTEMAAQVDAGYPANTDLRLDGGKPVLARRKGADRRASALRLEAAIHDRLPERNLLDILARSAYLIGWHRHFGPASGSDAKIRDKLGRAVLTTFANGTLLGPAQVARHMRGQVSAHELSWAANKHATCAKIAAATVDVINEFAKLDVAGVWGTGHVAGTDGSQIQTWANNLLAESHIRYGGYGGLAMRHISDTYVALFSHFIPCGVWEAVYIIEGLLRNESDIQPDTVHADTQGQSLPVFGLAALLGFDLLPRIRNWAELNFYRPDPQALYQHIDSLFGDNTIDWGLIETHFPDLLRTAISIREGRVSSVTLLRRLGVHSRKNRLYRAFRELGRVVRTITLLRYLSDPDMREQITAVTNKAEAYHGFSEWLRFGGEVIGRNDPDYQEKIVKFNELLANCVIYQNACDITAAANALAADGHPVDPDDLATIAPYITHTIRRFGDWVLDLSPPEAAPVTALNLAPGALFPGPITPAPGSNLPAGSTPGRRGRR